MEKTSKPLVAGIFNIVSGGLSIIGAIVGMISIGIMAGVGDAMPGFDMAMLAGIVVFFGIINIILGAFSIIGGIYCLKRRIWGLALAASIVAVLQTFFLGVPALILVAIAKDEFE